MTSLPSDSNALGPWSKLGAVVAFVAGLATAAVLFRVEATEEHEAFTTAVEARNTTTQSKWGPASDPVEGTHLIVAANRLKDEMRWLDLQPYAYSVMVKGLPAGTPNNMPINVGREPVSYLQFILEHYDDLPPRMIFVHGHNTSWHRLDIVGTLNALDPLAYDYADFANLFMAFNTNYVTLVGCYINSGAEQWLGPLPDPPSFLTATCCASFIVSRERVLSRSKAFYQWLFDWLVNTNENDGTTGRCVEWWWHVIFGRQWRTYAADPTILCPSNPQECGLDFIYQSQP